MSNWLAGIIGAAIGVLLGGIVTSCFALKAIRAAEKKASTQYQDGYEVGYEYGYKVGVKWISTLRNNKVVLNQVEPVGDKITVGRNSSRVDVAPGNDEHTEFILCCPMPFKSAKIVRSDEEPRIISCDRVDVAPGPDSIRPE